DIVVRHNLHFNQTRQTGVVFHMMRALGELGRTGLTAVGNSHENAKATYNHAVAVLDEETRGEAAWEGRSALTVAFVLQILGALPQPRMRTAPLALRFGGY